jgi:hypothetical protein
MADIRWDKFVVELPWPQKQAEKAAVEKHCGTAI